MTVCAIKLGYKVSNELYNFINDEVIPGLDVENKKFWSSFSDILEEYIPRNKTLLAFRETLQTQIDEWHKNNSSTRFNQQKYQDFLYDIGYLLPDSGDFKITSSRVDDEVAITAGPQLVVPLMNARFALNATNSRWGSLYDALYGTDVINEQNEATKTIEYNPIRGGRVQTYGRKFLDQALPLKSASHADTTRYHIEKGELIISLQNGLPVGLIDASQFIAFNGSEDNPTSILCCHNGLHIEIQFDKDDVIGKTDIADIKDILLESALTTIQDCEDSIAAVDTTDKVSVYRNWLGLMKGDLTETFEKKGLKMTRSLNGDRDYRTTCGQTLTLPGRSLQFIRIVGHLMATEAILTPSGEAVPEGIVDAMIVSLIALYDLNKMSEIKNSKSGSIYIVKPKMHGPDEVRFCNDLFASIEGCLELKPNTIKMGIMDEERRTSANLKECIRAAKDRVAFINTGFLDRTGDEIHTSMQAGPMVPKERMKHESWIAVYEQRNVRIGLETGFKGRAQIGKGMWAVPEQMAAMVQEKSGQLQAGANCAWVPSPTAATLHAMHYHQVNVSDVQNKLIEKSIKKGEGCDDLSKLLTLPLLEDHSTLTELDIQNELDNNVQGILGYVVRWIDQGIGCSTVPDINNVGRMEDRATLRISSQHICNWLHHGLLTESQIMTSLKRMAKIVDQQNIGDNRYQEMAGDYRQNIAFNTAVKLIFEGKVQPSGYTEPLLHEMRRQKKLHTDLKSRS